MDFWGFLIMMEMPKDIKGFEKSITSSRTRVMVSGATAISAFWGEKSNGSAVSLQRRHVKQHTEARFLSSGVCLTADCSRNRKSSNSITNNECSFARRGEDVSVRED